MYYKYIIYMNYKRFIFFFGFKFGGLELKKSMFCFLVIFLVELRNGGNEYIDLRDLELLDWLLYMKY